MMTDETAVSQPMLRLPSPAESQAAMKRAEQLWRRHLAAWASDTLHVRASGLQGMHWLRENDFDHFYQFAA